MSSAYQVNPQKVNATPKQESIMGVVERLTYHSEESGYTVRGCSVRGYRN